MAFAPDGSGWLVGDGGVVQRTEDGGAAWIPVNAGADMDFYSLAIADNQSLWIAGMSAAGGAILHTSDAGATWATQQSGGAEAIISISAASPTHAWAVNSAGVILHTADGGETWRIQYTGVFTAVAAIDPRRACAVGLKGAIVHTSDGGVTWHLHTVRSTELNAVSFHARWAWMGRGRKGCDHPFRGQRADLGPPTERELCHAHRRDRARRTAGLGGRQGRRGSIHQRWREELVLGGRSAEHHRQSLGNRGHR